MPVYIEELTSEVTAVAGDLPLTAAQIDKLVTLVLKRLEEKQRQTNQRQQQTQLRSQAARRGPIRE